MPSKVIEKSYLRVPSRQPSNARQRFFRALLATTLSPVYLLLAHFYRVPGLRFRRYSAALAISMLCRRPGQVSLSTIYTLLFSPLDSLRYFEFDFAWNALSKDRIKRYLDVSSPRLLPILLLRKHHDLRAELLNPDKVDLSNTSTFAQLAGVEERCHFLASLVSDVPFDPGTFDAITCISVLEHIPEDKEALKKIWELLKPGGKLLLTIPCSDKAFEEHLDQDEYGLLKDSSEGFFFFQRFYDEALLLENVFSITGKPVDFAVYGENVPGSYRRNQEFRRRDPNYPVWREPYMMAKEYRYYERVSDLPGIGVVAMKFVKD
jgi:SAM-dependent methyltransferase